MYLPRIGLPPLLPDSQFTWIVDDVIAATDSIGGLGGAKKKKIVMLTQCVFGDTLGIL